MVRQGQAAVPAVVHVYSVRIPPRGLVGSGARSGGRRMAVAAAFGPCRHGPRDAGGPALARGGGAGPFGPRRQPPPPDSAHPRPRPPPRSPIPPPLPRGVRPPPPS